MNITLTPEWHFGKDLLRHLSDNSVKANLTIQNKSKYDIHVYDGLVPTGSEVSRPAEIIPAGLTSPGGEWSALPTAATMSGIILYDTPDLKTVSVFYFRVNSEGKNTVKVILIPRRYNRCVADSRLSGYLWATRPSVGWPASQSRRR